MLDSIVGAVVASSLSSVAESAAVGVVGGISTYMDGQKELKAADAHMKRMELNANLLSQHPNDYIQMRTSYTAFNNHNYMEVIRNLASMGFYDINLNSVVVKKGLFGKERAGIVTKVSINGAPCFDEVSVFPKDAHVVVDAIVHQKGDYLAMPELERIRRGEYMHKRPVRRCEYCGVEISDGQKYCIACGAPV